MRLLKGREQHAVTGTDQDACGYVEQSIHVASIRDVNLNINRGSL